jgi:uncharacterized membrane protein
MKNTMKIVWKIVRFLFAAFMIFAGVQHFINPAFYIPFVPSFLPFTTAIIYLSGLAEVLLGLMLFIPRYMRLGAGGILLLMILFLPIHVWDVFSSHPAIGSHETALIRLPIQFIFIFIAWKLWKLGRLQA